MNEVVKRRAAGALLLIGLAFIAVSLLPGVGESPGEEGVKVVVIDLGAPEPATPDALAMETPPPGVAAAPQAALADEGAQGTDSLPDPGEATADPEPEPEPESVAEPARASLPAETNGARPGLKLAETIAPVSQPKPSETSLPTSAVEKPSSPAPTLKASETASAPTPVKPATLPSPAPVPAIDAKPPSPAPAAGAKASWYVQVGGFADVRNAHQAQDRLKAAGEASIIAPMDSAKGTLYRVRAGPYASREAATVAQQKIAAGGFPGATVINP